MTSFMNEPKEIQLQHRAPVLSMVVVDGKDCPLSNAAQVPAEKEKETKEGGAGSHHHDGSHRVVLCSEEQLKTFHLPSLKAGRHKYKLTATEGMRVRKVQHVTLKSKSDGNRCESFVVVMTNEGEVLAFSNHSFRRYLKQECIKASDISGILSTVLTPGGEGFFLRSSSEWQRFAVGAVGGVGVHACSLDLPEGARPPPPKEAPVAPEEEPEKKEEEGKAAEGEKAEGPGEGSPKVGDISALSSDSANVSALPTDVTVDSIRDYTNQTVETHTEKVSGGTVTVVTKTTKKTIVVGDGGEETTVHQEESRETRDLVNGAAEDEIAKLKSLNLAEAEVETKKAAPEAEPVVPATESVQ